MLCLDLWYAGCREDFNCPNRVLVRVLVAADMTIQKCVNECTVSLIIMSCVMIKVNIVHKH